MTINTSNNISKLYSSVFQGNVSLYNNKLSQKYAPVNKVKSYGALGTGAMLYASNIKSASKELSSVLNDLTKPSGRSASSEEVSSSTDKSYAANKVDELVNSYNDLYKEALLSSADDPKAEKLASKLLKISRTYSKKLSDIGIGFNSDGTMSVDSEKLEKAVENGKLEKFFTENSGKNYGFTNQLSKLAKDVTKNTTNYVSKSEIGNSLLENFSYNSSGNTVQYNYATLGWLFDYSY